MQAMTQQRATEAQERASQSGAGFEYEGIRIESDDLDKMIPFVDQLLFYLRVARLKARPVTIRESKGVMKIAWRGRAPKAFRPARNGLLCISRGRWMDSFTVQAA